MILAALALAVTITAGPAAAIATAVRVSGERSEEAWRTAARRDLDSPCDWIRVLMDSYHDTRTAYEAGGMPRPGFW